MELISQFNDHVSIKNKSKSLSKSISATILKQSAHIYLPY